MILRVLAQGEAYNVPSKKSENGQFYQDILANEIKPLK